MRTIGRVFTKCVNTRAFTLAFANYANAESLRTLVFTNYVNAELVMNYVNAELVMNYKNAQTLKFCKIKKLSNNNL